MKFADRQNSPVVIQLPREIDACNAAEVTAEFRVAYRPGTIIVADMVKATFCDSLGTRELVNVHYWATAWQCELRVARPSAQVLRVWQLLGADQILAIYPSLAAARAGSNRRWTEARLLVGLERCH